MTNDEADDRYGSVNIAENDSSRLAALRSEIIGRYNTPDGMVDTGPRKQVRK